MKALLVDLDDTLFDHEPAERVAREHVFVLIARDTGLTPADAHAHYLAARELVKERLGERGTSHSRLLYLHEVAHRVRASLDRVAGWNDAFWTTYLSATKLRPGARELLAGARARGMKIAIVTDLVVETQLRKLAHFGLADAIDAMVVSEEVPYDKPAPEAFRLAAERLGVALTDCVMVGDSRSKDGAGARALGIPYYRAESSRKAEAEGEPPMMTLFEIAEALEIANA